MKIILYFQTNVVEKIKVSVNSPHQFKSSPEFFTIDTARRQDHEIHHEIYESLDDPKRPCNATPDYSLDECIDEATFEVRIWYKTWMKCRFSTKTEKN